MRPLQTYNYHMCKMSTTLSTADETWSDKLPRDYVGIPEKSKVNDNGICVKIGNTYLHAGQTVTIVVPSCRQNPDESALATLEIAC